MTTQDPKDQTIDPTNTPESTLDAELDTLIEEATLVEEPTVPNEPDQVAGLQASLARSQADYANLLMRVERDKADMAFFLSAKMLAPLLTQIDNLERAVALKTGVEGDAFVDGIRSVLAGFAKFLESQGVTAFASVGSEVDPDRHDVMTEMPGAAGVIVQEFERGYMLRDRVLRHAKVIVWNGN
jgi:molecular chaperone GrpE